MVEFKHKLILSLILASILLSGCLGSPDDKPRLIQTGSSTVLPLAIVWAEEFDDADITVSGGGSSHGLNSLLRGESDFGGSSRLLKGQDYEKVGCIATDVKNDGTVSSPCKNVTPTKWVVAYDVLAVIVNNENMWAKQLTYPQLYKIFADDEPALFWNEIEGLENAPHEKIEIYSPDEASGTYDFFYEEIIPNWGKDNQKANTRLELGDGVYHPSADDNVILTAVRENKFSIGYLGYAYFRENKESVSSVAIKHDGEEYIIPTLSNVGEYPMARPLQIYTNGVPKLSEPRNMYLKYILSDAGQEIVDEVGYVRLSQVDVELLETQKKIVEGAKNA